MFDNIHNEGISKQEWLGKFYCLAIDLVNLRLGKLSFS